MDGVDRENDPMSFEINPLRHLRNLRMSVFSAEDRAGAQPSRTEAKSPGCTARTPEYRRIFSSAVTKGHRCSLAVATMIRSAGSPWKSPGRRHESKTAEMDRGSTPTPTRSVARAIQSSSYCGNAIRPRECSMATSQQEKTLTHTSCGGTRSKNAKAFCDRRLSPVIHQTQTCVSRRITGLLPTPPRAAPTQTDRHRNRAFP